jgi:hypothetical protein
LITQNIPHQKKTSICCIRARLQPCRRNASLPGL